MGSSAANRQGNFMGLLGNFTLSGLEIGHHVIIYLCTFSYFCVCAAIWQGPFLLLLASKHLSDECFATVSYIQLCCMLRINSATFCHCVLLILFLHSMFQSSSLSSAP